MTRVACLARISLSLFAVLLLEPACRDRRATPVASAADRGADLGRPHFPPPPPREPGPPRVESEAQIEAAAREAQSLAQSLLQGGVSRREVASVADMRGYRLYGRRAFGEARAWFRAAVVVDPTFELSLYNAARCAALLGEVEEAKAMLARLAALKTPLAEARLRSAQSDPDLRVAVRRARHGPERR